MSVQQLTLVILAAGLSTRYGAPKPLEPLGPSGEHLPDYAIFDALNAGFSRVVYVIRPEFEETFRAHRQNALPARLEVHYAIQTPRAALDDTGKPRPWGTGHALLCAAPFTPGPFAMINGDDFYGRGALAHLATHLQKHTESAPPRFAAIGYKLRDTLSPYGGVSRAVCTTNHDGSLLSAREHLKISESNGQISGWCVESNAWRVLSGEAIVSMNCWGFSQQVFSMLKDERERYAVQDIEHAHPEFLVGAAIQNLIGKEQATVDLLPVGERWLGITFPSEREPVQKALAKLVSDNVYPSPLFTDTLR